MRDSKKCVKCGSERVVRFEGWTGRYESGNYVKAGILNQCPVDRHICLNCGYSEEWIAKVNLKMLNEYAVKKGLIE